MAEIIGKPQECINARCGASCDKKTVEWLRVFCGNNPRKCCLYEYKPYLYEKNDGERD